MKRIGIYIVLGLLLASCGNGKKSESVKKSSHEISVTILPQKYFVEQIAGDFLNVNVMIPPGASPATYEPTSSQLANLSNSDLYVKIGYSGFEMAWMDKLKSVNKHMTVIDCSEGINLIYEEVVHGKGRQNEVRQNEGRQDEDRHDEGHNDEGHKDEGHQHEGHRHGGGVDPHIWLSPRNVRVIATNINSALAEMYPEQAKVFSHNLAAFLTKIDALDRKLEEDLSGMEERAFFTYHPSLSYFARDYGFTQYPLELGGKTPSAAHLKKLVDIGLEKKIGVVFLQMQFDQHNAEVLAKEIGAEIVQINPLDEAWYDQMLSISEKIKANLK